MLTRRSLDFTLTVLCSCATQHLSTFLNPLGTSKYYLSLSSPLHPLGAHLRQFPPQSMPAHFFTHQPFMFTSFYAPHCPLDYLAFHQGLYSVEKIVPTTVLWSTRHRLGPLKRDLDHQTRESRYLIVY